MRANRALDGDVSTGVIWQVFDLIILTVSCLRNRLKKSLHQGRMRISSLPYACGHLGGIRLAMHLLDNTLKYVRCESSMRAGKGCRRKALPISPPALVSGILMHVISETGH